MMNWHGKNKAVTLSYDDGVEQDVRLIKLMDRYGIKGTFNVNTALQTHENTFAKSDILVHRLDLARLPEVYAGHELAVHTLHHKHLELLTPEEIRVEIAQDKQTLEQLTGQPVVGMAYPYGTYDARVTAIAAEAGIRYARTVKQTEQFGLSPIPLETESTCRHSNPRLLELARAFVEEPCDAPRLFYLWGHSYEFDERRDWERMEEALRILGGHDDVFYGTNAEVLLP